MARKRRKLLITLAVVVGVIVVLSVVLRIVLTRDMLVALIVPRIEKAVEAEIEIGDIGIRFPFGFGVDIKALAFDKKMPDDTRLYFSADGVVVRASLLSLLRRKPEINAAEIRDGYVRISYATPLENLEEGLNRIGDFVK